MAKNIMGGNEGVVWHSGSVSAPQPAGLGSNLDTLKFRTTGFWSVESEKCCRDGRTLKVSPKRIYIKKHVYTRCGLYFKKTNDVFVILEI